MGSAAEHRLTFRHVRSGPRVRAAGLALSLCLALGCRSRAPGGSASPSYGASAATASSAAAPSALLDLSERAAPAASRFATDPVWRRAGSRDAMDLARLAEAEGAAGLLEGVRAEGSVALVALAALPLAPDAELAAGALCDAIGIARPREPLLRAIHGIVSRPPRQGEQLDLSGLERCRTRLLSLPKESLTPLERDLVSSALAMLREWGVSP